MRALHEILAEQVGQSYFSDWVLIDQPMIDRFADATADHQYIHVDPVRAAGTPFGGTVAHGMLTLSLLPAFSASLARPRIDGVRMRINYGFDRIRFVQPVRSGSRLRMAATIAGIVEKRPGRFQQVMDVTIEVEGEDIPALTATWITQFLV